MEIIALDDGSHDGSVELLERLALQSPFPMTVIAQENTGNVGKFSYRKKSIAARKYKLKQNMYGFHII